MLQSIQGGNSLPQKGHVSPAHVQKEDDSKFSSTHFSSDSVTLSYKDLSGKEVSIEVEHTQLTMVSGEKYSDGDKAKWTEMVKSIREEFEKFQAKSIRDIISGAGTGDVKMSDMAKEPEKTLSAEEINLNTEELIEQMPEEWRPEAVSDRILGFTTAFFGKTESGGEDFYKLAKSAIEEGFKLAGDDLGQLPGDIDNVIAKTREMVMAKLDRWAEEQGILPKPMDNSGIDLSA